VFGELARAQRAHHTERLDGLALEGEGVTVTDEDDQVTFGGNAFDELSQVMVVGVGDGRCNEVAEMAGVCEDDAAACDRCHDLAARGDLARLRLTSWKPSAWRRFACACM
jgi:hypothetical protein